MKRHSSYRSAWLVLPLLGSMVFLMQDYHLKAANDPGLPMNRDGGTSAATSGVISGQVNPFTGTFSTGVPIEIPPGRNGFQPKLALSYGSTGALGVAGVGWDLPISGIMRTGLHRGTPTYTSTDEFYLNMNGSSSQLLLYSDGTYHTRVETWCKAIPYPSAAAPQYWIVQSKSGETYTFGNSATPSYFAYYITSTSQYNSWMLSNAKDVDGNTIDYTYTPVPQCTGCGYFQAYLPATIKYGANPAAGSAHFAEVDFTYAPSPSSSDVRDSYFLALGGAPVRQNRRLTTIQVKELTDQVVVRSYSLVYTTSTFTNRSLLASVSTTYTPPGGGTAIAPPAMLFEYSSMEDPAHPLPWDQIKGGSSFPPGLPFVSDQYKARTAKDIPFEYGSQLIDLNGDGLPDKADFLVTVNNGVSNTTQKIFLQQLDKSGNRTWADATTLGFAVTLPGQPFAYIPFDNALENMDKGVRFGDVNGDGVADKVDFFIKSPNLITAPDYDPASGMMSVYYASSGQRGRVGWSSTASIPEIDATINSTTTGLPFSYIWQDQSNTWHSLQRGTILADVNGDGFVDKIDAEDGALGTTLKVHLGTGNGFDYPSTTSWIPPVALVTILSYTNSGLQHLDALDDGVRLVDLNGDGLPDFVKYLSSTTGTPTLKVWWNTGAGWLQTPLSYPSTSDFGKVFSPQSVDPNTSPSQLQANDRGAMLIDMNGDGLPDKVDRYLPCYTAPPNDPADMPEACYNTITVNNLRINLGTTATEGGGSVLFSTYNGFAPWLQTNDTAPLPAKTCFSQDFYFKPSGDTQAHKQEASRDLGVRVVDLNGDGYPDFIKYFERENFDANGNLTSSDTANFIQQAHPLGGTARASAASPRRDYLVYITNPLGGTTAITYGPASAYYADTDYAATPPATRSVPWVVQSVTAGDGISDAITTGYKYYGPTFDTIERNFAGFRVAVTTAPDGEWTRTTYRQDFPYTGMAEKVEQFASGSTTAHTTSTTYYYPSPGQPLPPDAYGIYHPKKYSDTTVEAEGAQATTSVAYNNYDAYDNCTSIVTTAGTTAGTSSKRVDTTYVNDTIHWLLGFATSSITYDGAGPSTPTSQKHIFYDGNSSWVVTSLTKGEVTREDSWLDHDTSGKTLGGALWVTTGTTAYDSYGCASTVTQKNAGNGTSDLITTYAYEASTHRFVATTTKNWADGTTWPATALYTDTLGHFDIWGHVQTGTDYKGNQTTTVYDGMGRPTTVCVKPSGLSSSIKAKSYNYASAFPSSGSVGGSVSVTVPSPTSGCGGTGSLTSTTYYDGLGRTTKAQGPGFNSTTIYTYTQYDPGMGRVKRASRPTNFSDPNSVPSSSWLTRHYDILGRVSEEDGYGKAKTYAYAVSTYGGHVITVTVAGHSKATYTDGYGRVVQASSDVSPTLYYFYDIMGSLTGVSKNSSGASQLVTLTYDSWAHKLSYLDSDSGVNTKYYYDLAGRLIQQEDYANNGSGSKITTQLAYKEKQAQLSLKSCIEDTRLSTTYQYYSSGQGINSGEVQAVTDNLIAMSGQLTTAARTYSRSVQSNGNVATSVAYSLPWKEAQGQHLPLTFGSVSDWQGNPVSASLPGGEGFTTSYDTTSGLPAYVKDANCATNYAHYTGYDPEHLTQFMRNGDTIITTNNYDPPTGRLSATATTSAAGTVQNASYGYRTDDLVSAANDSAPSGGGNQSFSYDLSLRLASSTAPGGNKNYSYSSDGSLNLQNSDDRNLFYGSSSHRVTSDSQGWTYQYDQWGRLSGAMSASDTKAYAFDAWGRMTQYTHGSLGAGKYEYFGDGERFKKVTYDSAGISYEHITLGSYEVEQLPSNMVRYRWAIVGPTGVVAWKQQITTASAFMERVNRESAYTLASMAYDRFWNDVTFAPGGMTFAGIMDAGRHELDAVQAAGSFARNAFKGLSLDQEAQRQGALALLVLLGGGLVLLLWSRRTRNWVAVRLPRALFTPSPGLADSTARIVPLGIWTSPMLRHAARVLVVVTFFQGGMFLAPVATPASSAEAAIEAASPCSATFYPITDHLGTVTGLLDSTGAVVYKQAYFPFGQKDDANSLPKPTTCDNGQAKDPWQYGFTGQAGDDESGLIYMHARYYMPAIGHFLTPDSVLPNPSDAHAYDRYSYARNNPINLVDPSGHNPIVIALIVAAIVGAIIGAVQAGMAGQNVLLGALEGAVGAVLTVGFGVVGAMVWGAIDAEIHGGNAMRGALIGGASAALGALAGAAAGSMAEGMGQVGQGVVTVMAGGVVGGITSAATGGKFGEGFIFGAAAAGVSLAANEIADSIDIVAHDPGTNPPAQQGEHIKLGDKAYRMDIELRNLDSSSFSPDETLTEGMSATAAATKGQEAAGIWVENKNTGAHAFLPKGPEGDSPLAGETKGGEFHFTNAKGGILDDLKQKYPSTDWRVVGDIHGHTTSSMISGQDIKAFRDLDTIYNMLGYGIPQFHMTVMNNSVSILSITYGSPMSGTMWRGGF